LGGSRNPGAGKLQSFNLSYHPGFPLSSGPLIKPAGFTRIERARTEIHGKNHNLRSQRAEYEPARYPLCAETAKRFGLDIVFRQSNREGELIDWIQEAHAKDAGAIVLNPAGYTTTSIAIMDALLAVKVPTIEVHITNIHTRESFRHNSYISKAAKAVIAGFGIDGYALAITGLAGLLGARQKG
jgi:3-dehydroquinate dehydratase-2